MGLRGSGPDLSVIEQIPEAFAQLPEAFAQLGWRTRIEAEFATNTQKSYRAAAAIRSLDEAISVLTSLGFPLHVEEGPEVKEYAEWPKYLFHLRLGAKVCLCEADWKEWGPDWFASMEEARQAAGRAKQWQRGGIFTRNLPALVMNHEGA